jgi:hypothetical protein
MNYSKLANWIARNIITLGRLSPAAIGYLIFIMMPARKHTLEAAARFLNTSKSRFHYFLKDNSEIAVYTLMTPHSLIVQAYTLKILNDLIMVKDLLLGTNGQTLFYILMIK